MNTRQEALLRCIADYDAQLDRAYRRLEMHRRGDFDAFGDRKHPNCQIAADLRHLRDLYIKRASLRKEAGMNVSDSDKQFPWPYCGNVPARVRTSSYADELSARDYDSAYDKAKADLTGDDKTWWNATYGRWWNEPLKTEPE